ncbi:uncharacterized protein MELLADRAFT_116567 [Melampsora larici-populina 98AG31]|uniref:Uncharacterized protein n=1 Tax=Melampsora larici-populina (strain 98AG31 / pathotype 3-4-7) TaxID=747676 RepID=F4RMQ3_MELLP|nr:uncharacterized protein MELLADRAFT_116567 [Melampsora larici-populina 98AG31]EGG06338.1 hypothetical protein MELLADRAFT_116567 [Melampsora larici-populina 98AG31]
MSHRPLLPKNVKPRHGMNPFSQSYSPHSSTRWSHQTSSRSMGITRTLSEALKRASNTLSNVRSSSNMEYTQLRLSPQPKAVPKASKRRPSLARSVTSTLHGFFDVIEQPIVLSDQPCSLFDRCSSVAGLYGVRKTKRPRNSTEQDWDFRCRGEETGVKPRDENDRKLIYESGSFWISSFKSSGKLSKSSGDLIGASNYELQSYTPRFSPKNSYSDEKGCLMRPIR